jgi:hypothetical protein
MRQVAQIKVKFLKRIKFLFTGKIWVVTHYNEKGVPAQMECGVDRPKNTAVVTFEDIASLEQQAGARAVEQYKQHVEAEAARKVTEAEKSAIDAEVEKTVEQPAKKLQAVN